MPLPPEPSGAPLRSWSPYKLDDGSWGACYLGDTGEPSRALHPDHDRRGDSWTTTVLEVIERREDFALFRDSGRTSGAA